MVFCRTKYQQTSFCAPLVQNSGRNCISKVELRRNLSINGKLPGFEFGAVFQELNLNWSVFLQLGVRIAWNCGAFHWEFRSGKKLWSSELKMHSLWVVQRSEFWAPWFSTANFVRAVWNSGAQNSTPMVQWSFFLIEPPEAKTMGAIAQNESPEAKTMGAIVQKGQNHGSYRSKRSPRGHLDEAPMEMGFPKPFVAPLKKSTKC